MNGLWFLSNKIFPEVLNMSAVAGIAILVVMIARLVLRNSPKIFSYVLWTVVLFRLLCPISVSSPVSFYRLLDLPAVRTGELISTVDVLAFRDTYTEGGSGTEQLLPEEGYAGEPVLMPEKVSELNLEAAEAVLTVVAVIWLAGIFVAIVYSIVSYASLRKKMNEASPLRDNIYLADRIISPFVVGFLKPRIYLLSSMSEQEQKYIILHEQCHIRRGDHVIKMLAFAALMIHWFNPLVWLAFILSGKDMEMSCDEAVIREAGISIRADYSAFLLKMATGKRILAGMPLAFGEGDTKERIRNLSKWKHPAFIPVLGAGILSLIVFAACAVNPMEKDIEFLAEKNPVTGEMLENDKAILKEYFTEFLTEKQHGERGMQMAKECEEIIGRMGEELLPDIERMPVHEWFNMFYEIAKSREQRYTKEELQEYYPATWILLETEKEYNAENGRYIKPEEIDWIQIMEQYRKENGTYEE